MKYIETNFLAAILESFQKYEEFGERSTEKLKPLHEYIGEVVREIFGSGYAMHFMDTQRRAGKSGKSPKPIRRELVVQGKYYPKYIDIAVCKEGNPVLCVGIKFITSNYKQNANNYFETMMGETANIQAMKGLPYFQLIVFRHKTPYFKRDKSIGRIEEISERDLKKYLNLAFDTPQAHRPDAMGIILISVDEERTSVTKVEPTSVYTPEFAKLLAEKLSVEHFFNEIQNRKTFIELL